MDRLRFFLFALCLPLWACGDDGGSQTPADAAIALPDAELPPPDADPQARCPNLLAHYPNLGQLEGTASIAPADEDFPDGPKLISVQIPLNDEEPADILFVELWEGDVPYTKGFEAKTSSLIGDQSDLITCGACVYIAADHAPPQATDYHMSYSGQLELIEIDTNEGTAKIAAELRNVKMRKVSISQDGQENVENGCLLDLEGVSFDLPLSASSPKK